MSGVRAPGREDVAALLAAHIHEHGACTCGWHGRSRAHPAHLADVVLALYAPVVEQAGWDRAAAWDEGWAAHYADRNYGGGGGINPYRELDGDA